MLPAAVPVLIFSFGLQAEVHTVQPAMSSEAIVRKLSQPAREERGLVKIEDVPVSVDFPNIGFVRGSSELSPAAETQLRELGIALATPELAGFRFEIAGHTDSTGPASFNRSLSLERARTVRQFLIEQMSIPPDRVRIAGYGEDRLAMPDDPEASENRRVEIINLGEG